MIDYNRLAAQLADRAENPKPIISDWEKLYYLTEPNFWPELLKAFQSIYNKTAEDFCNITDLNPHLKGDKAFSKNRDLQSPLVFRLREKVAGLCNTPILKTSINELETGCNCDKCPLLLKIPERIKVEVLPEAKAQLSTLPPEFSRHFLEAEIRDALSQQREAKEAATKPGANLGGCSEMYVFNVERIQALRGVFAPPVNTSIAYDGDDTPQFGEAGTTNQQAKNLPTGQQRVLEFYYSGGFDKPGRGKDKAEKLNVSDGAYRNIKGAISKGVIFLPWVNLELLELIKGRLSKSGITSQMIEHDIVKLKK
jgi:hypothetical protein